MIIILHISLVLGEYSRYLAWRFDQIHEDTHQGEQMVTTKSQDHLTSPGMSVKYIAIICQRIFSFAQPYSFFVIESMLH